MGAVSNQIRRDGKTALALLVRGDVRQLGRFELVASRRLRGRGFPRRRVRQPWSPGPPWMLRNLTSEMDRLFGSDSF